MDYSIKNKLRQFEPTNRIIDDSDSKPSELERQFRSNSKLDIEIGFQLKYDDKI